MEDWEELDDGPKLDRIVAEKLGWRIQELAEPKVYVSELKGQEYRAVCPYVLVNEQGEPHGTPWQTPELCWHHAELPAFSTSVDAALTLIPRGTHCEIAQSIKPPLGWLVSVGDKHAIQYAYTLARAIVASWLTWKEGGEE